MVAVHDLALARLALGANSLAADESDQGAQAVSQSCSGFETPASATSRSCPFTVDLASALNNLGQAELAANAVSAAEQDFWNQRVCWSVCIATAKTIGLLVTWEAYAITWQSSKNAKVSVNRPNNCLSKPFSIKNSHYQSHPIAHAVETFLAEHRAQLARLTTQQP